MLKKILLLLILLLIFFFIGFSRKLAVLPQLMKPGSIEISENKVYILDGLTVCVYSMGDYSLVTKFGKRGQGPGELVPNDEIPLQMRLLDGDIFLNSQTKIIRYTKEGRMLMEKTFPFLCMQIVPLGEGFAVSRPGMGTNGAFSIKVGLYDSRLKPIKTLTVMEKDDQSIKGKIVIPPPYIYLHRANDTLYVTGGNQRDFYIEVFDRKGYPLRAIKMSYQRLKLTDAFEKELVKWFKTDSRFSSVPLEVFQRLHFLRNLPAIRNIVINTRPACSSWRMYVQTYRQQNGLSEFFIFDLKGSLLKKTYLPSVSRSKVKMNHEIMFTFYNNKYYYLMENLDAEEWGLHMQDLNQK